MSDIEVDNIREYILSKIMICGELRCYGQGTSLPTTPRYANQILEAMEEDGALRRYKYSDGKNSFRPNKPKGENEMSTISDELWNHFSLMAGNANRRYKGTKKDRLKIRGLYKTTEMMFENGIICDMMQVHLKGKGSGHDPLISPFTDSGALLDPGHIMSSIPPDRSVFLSSRITRSLADDNAKSPRDIMYRSIGTLIKGSTVYYIYHVYAVNEMWWSDVEYQMSEALKRNIEENVPYIRNHDIRIVRKQAIFYFTSETVLRNFILSLKNKRENRIDPDTVYGTSYGVYLSGNAGDITNMLLVPNWKSKVNIMLSRIFNAEIVDNEKYDMRSSNGIPIYDLLCCNMSQMKKLKSLVMKHESIIIIHPWMRNTAEELYENRAEIFEISDSDFKRMLEAVM